MSVTRKTEVRDSWLVPEQVRNLLIIASFAFVLAALAPAGSTVQAAESGSKVDPTPETPAEIAAYREYLVQKKHQHILYPEVVKEISSLEELAEYAGRSGVHVRMKPGIYKITEDNYRQFVGQTSLPRIKNKDRKPATDETPTVGTEEREHLLHFSGMHSLYDLRGVTIKIESKVAALVDSPWHRYVDVLVSGDNLIIRGLTLTNTGNHPNASNAKTLGVEGNRNLLQGLEITSRGSTPYGYGSLVLFWSGDDRGFQRTKRSALLARGNKNVYVDCSIHQRAIGHAIMFGANNSNTFIDCMIDAEKRSTDDILEETSGPLAQHNFVSRSSFGPSWRRGKIKPGHVVSLSEDAFRAYWIWDPSKGKAPGELKILGCTVKNTRGAVVVRGGNQNYDPVFISNTRAVGINWQGSFWMGRGDTRIVNCEADLRYGDFLRLFDLTRGVEADITLLPSDPAYLPREKGRVAVIDGQKHDIVLKSKGDLGIKEAEDVPPILIKGEDIELRNRTALPVRLTKESRNCHVVTGEQVTDNGQGNNIKHIE